MVIKQAPRLLSLETKLGENELLLVSFTGREEMSRLFEFHLDMTSDNNAIQAQDIVGQELTFAVKLADDAPRFFHGFVSRFGAGEEDDRGRRNYRAVVVPWLWFLTRTSDCRIFQNLSVPEIIRKIFSDLGFQHYDDSQIRGSHPKHIYRVQYRETDFDFVSRLAEEEGIFYFFKHEEGKHTLVLADQAGAYHECTESVIDYPSDVSSDSVVDHITSWDRQFEFRTGKVALTDYNFETPSTSLMTNERTFMKTPGADKYEFYDYPGSYPTTAAGKPLTRIRMEEIEAGHELVQGASTCSSFATGGKFRIGRHRSASEEGKSFVLTRVEHAAAESMAYESGRRYEGGYRNTFTCIPDATVFRPARTTPKPTVRGPHTAVVVGPPGETIYPDEYGRVKVQFHWDREGKKNENSSCWVRVSQNWAGADWGGMFIPHVGQEVIVDFLEGDPDRPIITGRVYNAEQTVPLDLPANKTKCILRDHGNNQMVFDGKEGNEFIHLQQECGNELLMNGMPGQESVQLRDKFGNEIFMDAANGTMRFSSPSHNSTIILGNSIYQACESNNSSFTLGDTLNIHKGFKHDVYKGFRTQTDIGGYYEAMLGWKSVVVLGIGCTGAIGTTVGMQYSKEVTLNKKEYVHHGDGPIKIDSDAVIGLCGGAGDASKAILGQHRYLMSFQHSTEPPRPSFTKGEILQLVGGLAAHSAMVVSGAQMYAMKDRLNDKAEDLKASGRKGTDGKIYPATDEDITSISKEWTNTNVTEWAGEAMAGAGVIAGIVAAKAARNNSEIDPHKAPQGQVCLSDAGVGITALDFKQRVVLWKQGIQLESEDQGIQAKAKGPITLETKSDKVMVRSVSMDCGNTKIKQKNLLVD